MWGVPSAIAAVFYTFRSPLFRLEEPFCCFVTKTTHAAFVFDPCFGPRRWVSRRVFYTDRYGNHVARSSCTCLHPDHPIILRANRRVRIQCHRVFSEHRVGVIRQSSPDDGHGATWDTWFALAICFRPSKPGGVSFLTDGLGNRATSEARNVSSATAKYSRRNLIA